MKVTIEIDCTPIEARKFFGLPNVEPIQEMMMAKIERRMAEAAEQFSPEALMGSWFSLFPRNAEWVQKMFADAMGHNKPTKR